MQMQEVDGPMNEVQMDEWTWLSEMSSSSRELA